MWNGKLRKVVHCADNEAVTRFPLCHTRQYTESFNGLIDYNNRRTSLCRRRSVFIRRGRPALLPSLTPGDAQRWFHMGTWGPVPLCSKSVASALQWRPRKPTCTFICGDGWGGRTPVLKVATPLAPLVRKSWCRLW